MIAKNFAFICRDNDWVLAPAFDILESEGLNDYHTSSFNDKIQPSKQDLFVVAEKAGLERKKAITIFNEMNTLTIDSTIQ